MNIDIFAQQIQGKRDYQEDAFAQRNLSNATLLILADGMGGYDGGKIASKIVVDGFLNYPYEEKSETFLEDALTFANNNIASYKEKHPEVLKMGTTLIALLIKEKSYQWISVGDSPLYLIQHNKIKRINQNHSVAGMLEIQFERGEISKEALLNSRNRHQLTSAILGDEIIMTDVSSVYKLEEEMFFLLASDGIETLSQKEILSIVQKSSSIESSVEKILEEITDKKLEHQDNVSLMLGQITCSEEECPKSDFLKRFIHFIGTLTNKHKNKEEV